MNDFRLTITLEGLATAEQAEANAEAMLDGFIAAYPEGGPVVSVDLVEETLSIVFVVQAEDAMSAAQAGRTPFARGAAASGLDPDACRIVALEIEPVEASAGAEPEPELVPA
jgi:hypothetical protein